MRSATLLRDSDSGYVLLLDCTLSGFGRCTVLGGSRQDRRMPDLVAGVENDGLYGR